MKIPIITKYAILISIDEVKRYKPEKILERIDKDNPEISRLIDFFSVNGRLNSVTNSGIIAYLLIEKTLHQYFDNETIITIDQKLTKIIIDELNDENVLANEYKRIRNENPLFASIIAEITKNELSKEVVNIAAYIALLIYKLFEKQLATVR